MLAERVCTCEGLLVRHGDKDDVPAVVLDRDKHVPAPAVTDVEGPRQIHTESVEEALLLEAVKHRVDSVEHDIGTVAHHTCTHHLGDNTAHVIPPVVRRQQAEGAVAAEVCTLLVGVPYQLLALEGWGDTAHNASWQNAPHAALTPEVHDCPPLGAAAVKHRCLKTVLPGLQVLHGHIVIIDIHHGTGDSDLGYTGARRIDGGRGQMQERGGRVRGEGVRPRAGRPKCIESGRVDARPQDAMPCSLSDPWGPCVSRSIP